MPDRPVFLDTNGWIALLNSSDALHAAASSVWSDLLRRGSTILLTDWIIAETGNGLARTNARTRFPRAVTLIRESPRARLIPVSESLFQAALDLYGSRPDKTWGLVDCASFLAMQEHRIAEVVTNDRHFKQAGFECLLPLS
jgi:predicted nucleic acid-binding protein